MFSSADADAMSARAFASDLTISADHRAFLPNFDEAVVDRRFREGRSATNQRSDFGPRNGNCCASC